MTFRQLDQLRGRHEKFEYIIQPEHGLRVGSYALDIFLTLEREVFPFTPITLPEHDHNMTALKIMYGSLLHDIGKESIKSQHIFYNNRKLTPEEKTEVEEHPSLGADIIRCIDPEGMNPIIDGIADIVESHHEEANGSGYPYGLKGLEIPTEARIISVCDKFDAVTVDRGYNHVKAPQEAIAWLRKDAKDEFDSFIVNVLENLLNDPRSTTSKTFQEGQLYLSELKKNRMLPLQQVPQDSKPMTELPDVSYAA